ncbi:hypothetical protein [Paraliomyxa miuraensis]|uniref:hypothetical protein n=1 Tax=Paraliomyxa miuraensis TaxID=376150 RepID=UPI002259B499|nr:hypothetical protein [Paraliomyxa miuraensis]MCX4245632.1 hypothetical protein [Paraliomyxa miuraensis]
MDRDLDRYKAYILPGAAALVLLAYYAWRWTSGAVEEPAPAEVPATGSTPTAPATKAGTAPDGPP